MKTWAEQIVTELNKDKKGLKSYRGELDEKKNPSTGDLNDFELTDEMIADLNYALNHIRTGRVPGTRRGIGKRQVYKRTELAKQFPNLTPYVNIATDAEKQRVIDILMDLSLRERQCFILQVTQGLTQIEIAGRLKVSRTSVQKYIDRAKAKVQQAI